MDNHEATNDTEYLLNIPGMKESILEGEKERIEDCKSLDDIAWNID